MKVNRVYLNHPGRENIAEVIDLFYIDKGPLKFQLLDADSNSSYFQLRGQLGKISLSDLTKLSRANPINDLPPSIKTLVLFYR